MLNIHWKDWCWSWHSNTLVTWCEESTHWKRPWCWERLKMGGEGDDRGWDGWMTSLNQWTWVWASSRRQWRTGKPGMLQSIWLQSWTQLSNPTTTPINLMKAVAVFQNSMSQKIAYSRPISQDTCQGTNPVWWMSGSKLTSSPLFNYIPTISWFTIL